ncbi:MAG TPA: DUF1206 domain-containing protein [Anaeromyxobacter sp.]
MPPPSTAWRSIERATSRWAARPAVQKLQRAGFVARGAVYAVVAALALALALRLGGGETTDTRGALAALAATRPGRSLLVVLGIALAGLALFFVVEALAVRRSSSRAWAAAMRVGNAVAALGYAALAVAAERLGRGEAAGPTGARIARTWTGRALELPGGRWLVLAVAAAVVFAGARQAWRGVRRTFLQDLDVDHLEGPLRRWAAPLGTAAFSVQGTVFVIVGLFFAAAGIRNAPREATGFDGALAAIAHQRWGPVLLAAVALGLFAYAAYSIVEGRHRRLEPRGAAARSARARRAARVREGGATSAASRTPPSSRS